MSSGRAPASMGPEERWEQGVPHDPRSEAIGRRVGQLDLAVGDDRLDLNFGGDGDNGEHLLYLLDIYFAEQDEQGTSPAGGLPCGS